MHLSERLPLFVIAILLCVPLAYAVVPWHTRYWLIQDGIQGTALITAEGSHGSVYYTYVVAGKTFAGHSQTNWRDDRYRDVKAGWRAPVWYSASRPWLSMLYKPDSVAYGWFFVLFVSIFQLAIIIPAFWPALGRKLWRRGRG